MDVRCATSSDVDRLVDIMFEEPTRESIAVAGSGARGARRFQARLFHAALAQAGNVLLVAADDRAVVGFAFVSNGSDTPPVPKLLRIAIRSLGIAGTMSAARRARARLAVELTPPPGGLHIVELHVDAPQRGHGVGGMLLAAAEAHARREGAPHLSLTTHSANPARRLYERNGYRLTDQRSDAAYSRLAGVQGRVLYVKTLTPPEP